MDVRTHSMENTFLSFSAILPWELSIGPPWLEREMGFMSLPSSPH
jgi:hypothetical protein